MVVARSRQKDGERQIYARAWHDLSTLSWERARQKRAVGVFAGLLEEKRKFYPKR